MLLYCIRHGESTYNAEGRIQGQSDSPLSELGHRQSQAVATALAGQPIEAIYASPLKRALQTAQPIARTLNLEIRTDPRLKEIHVGLWESKFSSDVIRQYAEEFERWKSGDFDSPIPGGESRRDLLARGRQAFDAIRRSGYRQVVVVAHGGLLLVTLKDLLGIPKDKPPHDFENGSVTKLTWDGQHRVELLTLDQVDHLCDVG